MNNIEKEITLSKKYYLKESNNLILLTQDNVARVEAMIVNDSDYAKSSNPKENSTAKWMIELRKFFNGESTEYKFDDIVANCVRCVDTENSTHLSSDGVGLTELTGRIIARKGTLLNELKYPKKNNYNIIDILSEPTHPKQKPGKKYYPRKNYSFATKFCHYACFYIFAGLDEQDNFSIYDNIVAKNIGKYAKEYKVTFRNDININYSSFISTVDAIIKASGNQISRNGFDHLLWYYHKARQ